jgi:hypothetical protein
MNNVDIQSSIRGIDNRLILKEALDASNPETAKLLQELSIWTEQKHELSQAITGGPEGLARVVDAMHKLSRLNFDFYKRAASCFGEQAQRLEPPREP